MSIDIHEHRRPTRDVSDSRLTTKGKLKAWLAAHPNACSTHSLADIGRELGVSREMVRQIMPWYARQRVGRVTPKMQRVLDFLEHHPEAVLSTREGGMAFKDIAAATGVSDMTVLKVMVKAGYPSKRVFAEQERGDATVVAWETCWNCGGRVAWTWRKTYAFKGWRPDRTRGRLKYIVCSHACGRALRGLTREEAQAQHEAREATGR